MVPAPGRPSGMCSVITSYSIHYTKLYDAWDGLTVDNKIWGYPISVEAVGLIYNKALVKTPPKSFEEILKMKMPKGKRNNFV